MRELAHTHDLRLPDWGPYTKQYMGISHIADKRRGWRFDLSVFPGLYRRRVDIPSVLWESGYHPWEAAPDLRYYTHRHELEWKDRVYCDISFAAVSDQVRYIRCHCVNQTDLPQNLVLHYMASLHAPTLVRNTFEPLRMARVELPPGGVWVDALDYTELSFASPRPTDSLVPDARRRGEVRGHGFTAGSGLGTGFGAQVGDRVTYCFSLQHSIAAAALVLRYRVAAGKTARFRMQGCADSVVELDGCGDLRVQRVEMGSLPAGEQELTLISTGNCSIELDGFAVVPAALAEAVCFPAEEWRPVPEILPGPLSHTLILKYQDVDHYYGLRWDYPLFTVREFYSAELDPMLRYLVHDHVRSVFHGNGVGHFTNVFMRPIELPARSTRTVDGVVCCGTLAEVTACLATVSPESADPVYEAAQDRALDLACNPAGRKYLFSQERMAATTLTNVVYPVYIKQGYIKHNTPGRWWDSLYTWDSGFLGLGLLELDLERAIDCLNAYLAAPGDRETAFVHHGSPVPVQFYLFLEIWNRTQDRELLTYFYPRLRQYHRFLCGRLGSSTTGVLKSNLLKTWDYFYNSGGWDDYPPQVYVHRHKLEPYVAPVVNTAHAIRTAKILRMAAQALGMAGDLAEYEADIARFSHALHKYSWDPDAGYFSYVCHSEQGEPTGILRHESGANFNMGLDGASPLVAGVCTSEQRDALLTRLMSPQHMWTPCGLSTVDTSAPYYRTDGYWNGAVWMPHQWFFWKALLDLGRGDLAHRIAATALEVWRREVDASYNCFEHFIVSTGRGAGWHHFGGLSTPVLAWFSAYHRPGHLSCGLDIWVESASFSAGNTELTAVLQLHGAQAKELTVIAAMAPHSDYKVLWNGAAAASRALSPGVLEIQIPAAEARGTLLVQPMP